MARFDRMQVLNEMYRLGLVPIFYNPDLEAAKKIVAACAAGGARLIELTNRGDYGFKVFSKLVEYAAAELPELILGVGSVLEGATAAQFLNAGANFVVSPNLNPEVARMCNRRKVTYIPGCGTVSEISQAEELGSEIVKIFPGGQIGGPGFIKAVRGPLPWTSIMPTGGVAPTRESLGGWIEAGAVCLGLGSNLISKDAVAKGDFEEISRKVADCLALIEEVRAGM